MNDRANAHAQRRTGSGRGNGMASNVVAMPKPAEEPEPSAEEIAREKARLLG